MDKQKRLLEAENPGHFSMIRALHLADLITLGNGMNQASASSKNACTYPRSGFCGIMSIFSSMRYCLGNDKDYANLYYALAFVPFGLFFDFMDGKVARWRKKSSLMGQELDSLADLVRLSQRECLAYANAILGILWRLPSSCCFCSGFPHTC